MMRKVIRRAKTVAAVAMGLILSLSCFAKVSAQTPVAKKQAILVYSLVQTGTAVDYRSWTLTGATSPRGSNILTSTMTSMSFLILERRPATAANPNSYQGMAFVRYYTIQDPRGLRKFYEIDGDKRYRILLSDETKFASRLDETAPKREHAYFQELTDSLTAPTKASWSLSRMKVFEGESTDDYLHQSDLWALQGPTIPVLLLSSFPVFEIKSLPPVMSGRWQEGMSLKSKAEVVWPSQSTIDLVLPTGAKRTVSTNQFTVSKYTEHTNTNGAQKATLSPLLTALANPTRVGTNGGDTLPDTDDDLPTGTLQNGIDAVVAQLESLGYNPLPE